MQPLRLRTFGMLRLDGPGGAAIAGVRRRELAVLAYLARHAPARIGRERLAAVFWGERGEARARHSLRQVLFRMRGALGSRLDVTPESVAVAAGAIELDAAEFEADVAAGRLAAAVERYGGEFLSGAEDAGGDAFRVWLEEERARMARLLSWSLARLVEGAQQRADWPEVERWAERWRAAFPFEEAAVVPLLDALQRSGRRAEALARRDAFLVRLREELGTEPSDLLLRDIPDTTQTPPARLPVSAVVHSPELIGRTAAIAAFESLWRAVGQHGAALLVEGEPGMGMTRLASELGRRATASGTGAFVLWARSEEHDPSPFAVARRLFAPLRHAPGLSGASDDALARLAVLVPSLRDRFPRLPPCVAADERLVEAARDVLAAVGAEQPVLLVADDFARYDAPTRELLLALTSDPPASLLVLLATRSDELRRLGRLAGVDDAPSLARVKLQPLDAAQVEALVASMVKLSSDAQRRELARRVHAASDGVPFYAVELVSALADTGMLGLDPAGRWQLTARLEGAPLPIPGSVDAAIGRRLDALGPVARVTLEAAAVIGHTADAAVLERVAGMPASEFAAATAELVACRLLRSANAPAPGYEFTHELIRRVAYARLPASRRRALHAGVVNAVEGRHGDAPDAGDVLRYHREQAGEALPPRSRKRGRRWLLPTSGVLILTLTGIGLTFWRNARAVAADPQARVIVLPFDNLTGDAELGPMSRIVSDWIAQAIGRTALVKVAPPPAEAEWSAAGGPQDTPLERARFAHADIAVRGRYQRTGDSLRIISEVVEVRSGRVLGVAGPVSSDPRDPMPAIDEMSERVLAVLSPWVDPRLAAAAAVQSRPPTYAAYLAFAEGLDHFYARRGELALPHFLRAYALDTTYTLPLLYAVVQHEGHSNIGAADSLLRILRPRRGELAPYDRAIFDYELAMVERDWRGMYAAAQTAAEIAPASLLAVVHLPRVAMALNLPGRAVAILSAVDPDRSAARGLPAYWHLLAHALHMTGEHERQLAVAREVRRRMPHEHRALSYQARALAALGRLRELDAVLEESWLLPSIPNWGPPGFALHGVVAQELAAHGHRAHARVVLERAMAFHESAPPELMRIPRHAFEVARALYHLDRLEPARAIFEELSSDQTVGADARGYLGMIAVLQDDGARAAALGRWLRTESNDVQAGFEGAGLEYLARMAALRGRRDEAVRLLRQAMANGREYDSGKHLIWEFASLRGYPPFEEWLRPKE